MVVRFTKVECMGDEGEVRNAAATRMMDENVRKSNLDTYIYSKDRSNTGGVRIKRESASDVYYMGQRFFAFLTYL
jgi:hypothetical protein